MNEVQNTASDNNLPIYYQDTDSIHMNNNQVATLEKKYVYSLLKSKSLIEIYAELGYMKGDSNTQEMIKIL